MVTPTPHDYGKTARIGVATPQANPTVEAEMAVLMPRTVSLQACRLVSKVAEPLPRLVDYFDRLEEVLSTYGGMALDTVGIACTGSSYLIGAAAEDDLTARLTADFGYPVITAAQAIARVFEGLGIRRIKVIAPYPEGLLEKIPPYWAERDVEVVRMDRVVTRTSDTTTIYELTSADAVEALRQTDASGCDAIFLSGTGMPGLPAIKDFKAPVPVLSSNLCLAWAMLDKAGVLRDRARPPFIEGWEARLAEAL